MRISDWSSDVCSSDLEAFDGELGSAVGGGAHEAERAAHRGEVEDVSAALAAHDRQYRAGDAEAAEDVGGELPLDGGGRQLLEEAELAVAGIVHQHVAERKLVEVG